MRKTHIKYYVGIDRLFDCLWHYGINGLVLADTDNDKEFFNSNSSYITELLDAFKDAYSKLRVKLACLAFKEDSGSLIESITIMDNFIRSYTSDGFRWHVHLGAYIGSLFGQYCVVKAYGLNGVRIYGYLKNEDVDSKQLKKYEKYCKELADSGKLNTENIWETYEKEKLL